MKQGNAPTLEEWQDLYTAVDAFGKAAPWTWMDETAFIGVTDPETGEVGYCSVMGSAGQHFALAVYEGKDGLESFFRLQVMGDLGVESIEVMLCQKCLMASFEDREELAKEDREVIKALGLKFRGKKAWPVFRRYRPLRMPWHLNAHEARFLAAALHQVVEVSMRYRKDPELLGSEDNPTFLVRTCKGGQWTDERQTPPEFDEPELVTPYIPDDLAVERIKRLPLKWEAFEADFALMPSAIEDGDTNAPYFPYLLILAEPSSHFILCTELQPPFEYAPSFAKAVMDAIEAAEGRPRVIRVGRPELADIIEEIGRRCDIAIVTTDSMEALDEIFATMHSTLF